MGEIKLMIVDDHEMVRQGLKNYLLLAPHIRLAGEAANGSEALYVLENMEENERPDVILLDLMMPELDGIAATREILSKYPQIKVIVLTSFLEEDKVVEAIEAGASGYLLKTVTAPDLIQAVEKTCRGQAAMEPEVLQALTRGLRRRTHVDEDGMTFREREVLLLIAEGKTNKEIAEDLHISIKTVKTHVSNLLAKCGLEDRTQLAIYAHRKGWVKYKSAPLGQK